LAAWYSLPGPNDKVDSIETARRALLDGMKTSNFVSPVAKRILELFTRWRVAAFDRDTGCWRQTKSMRRL